MDQVEGRLGNIESNQYEKRTARVAIQLAGLELDIEGPRAAFSHFGDPHPNFNHVLQTAFLAGSISREEFRDLLHTDLVIYGRNRRYLIVEISPEPGQDNISSALRRAEILQRATGEQVTAVVAAPDPQREFVSEAEARDVTVLDLLA